MANWGSKLLLPYPVSEWVEDYRSVIIQSFWATSSTTASARLSESWAKAPTQRFGSPVTWSKFILCIFYLQHYIYHGYSFAFKKQWISPWRSSHRKSPDWQPSYESYATSLNRTSRRDPAYHATTRRVRTSRPSHGVHKCLVFQPMGPSGNTMVDDIYAYISTLIAYFFIDPPTKPVTPVGLRALELILIGGVDNTIDFWSFSYLIVELLTGQPLFWVAASKFEDNNHILSLTAQLGALPAKLVKHWKTLSLYFTLERKFFNCHLGGIVLGEELLIVE